MMNFEKLKKEISRRKFSYSEIAKALNVTRSCISHKMNGVIEFSVGEIDKLVEFLGLSGQEKADIFFGDKTSEKEKRNDYLNEDEKLEIVRRIINIFAEEQCTAEEAEDILCSAKRSVASSAIVQYLN